MTPILFRVDGNSTTGLGHISRCLKFAYCLKYFGFNSIFLSNINNYSIEKKINESFTLIKCAELNKKKENINLKIIRSYQKKFKSDFLILDSNNVSLKFLKLLKRINLKSLIITDLYTKGIQADYCINYNTSQKYKFKNVKNFFFGSEYVINSLKDNINNKSKSKYISIFFGATDSKKITEKILQLIKDYTKQDFIIVLGPFNERKDLIYKKFKNFSNIKFESNTFEIEKILNKSKLVICSGGIFNNERVLFNLPAITISINKIQGKILKNQAKLGLCRYLGDYKRISKKIFFNNFENILENYQKEKQKIIENNFVDTQSSLRTILSIFIEKFKKKKKIQKANIRDNIFLYNLIKSKNVFDNSVSKKTIKFIDYSLWFKKKLKSQTSQIYILRILNINIGQIRFDIIKKKIAEIDISVHHDFLDNSFESYLLNNGIKLFSKEKKIKIFKSHVLKTNKESQKMFIKNKFLLSRKNQNIIEYVKIIK